MKESKKDGDAGVKNGLPKGFNLDAARKLLEADEARERDEEELTAFRDKLEAEVTQLEKSLDVRNVSMVQTLHSKKLQLEMIPGAMRGIDQKRSDNMDEVMRVQEELLNVIATLAEAEERTMRENLRATSPEAFRSDLVLSDALRNTSRGGQINRYYQKIHAKVVGRGLSVSECIRPCFEALERWFATGSLLGRDADNQG